MRYELPDKIKFAAILLVLAGHLTFPAGAIHWIYSFHMPLFFIISGAFAKGLDGRFSDFAKRQFKRLILPYFIFGALLLAHYCVYAQFAKYGRMEIDFAEILKRFALGNLSVLWFLSALFFASIFCFLSGKISRSPKFLLPFTLAIAVCAAWLLRGTEGFWCANIALVALFYFELGSLLLRAHSQKPVACKAADSPLAPMAGLALCAAAFFACPFNLPYEMATMRFGNPLLYIPISIAGCGGIALLAKRIPYCAPVRWIAANTLTIFCTHLIVYSWCRGALKIFFSISYPETFTARTLAINLLLMAAALLAAVPVKFCLNKIFPTIVR